MRSLSPSGDAAESLSPREFEVLRMLVDGKAVGEIARSLGLTTKTVANHQSALRQKLGARALRAILEKVLHPILFVAPERAGERIIIGPEEVRAAVSV